MNVFFRPTKIVLSVLYVALVTMFANASNNICNEDPVDILKEQVNKCEWLGSDSKNLLKITPHFHPFCEKVIACVKSSSRPQAEINLEQAKTDAIKFFSKYLSQMPDFINIAKEVINNGHYTYVNLDNWIHIIDSQMQYVVSDEDAWSNNIDAIIQSLMRGKNKEDIVKRCIPFLNMDAPLDKEAVCRAMKFIDEIECKYMDLSNIAKNFEIKVYYTNQKTLLITAIQETGQVLDYAYRIKYGKCSKTFTNDLEAISIFFETIAKRDFESSGYDFLRLIAPYETMMGFDLIHRANNRLNGIMGDIATLEQIRHEVEHDWQSPLAELMQLGIGNGEILKFVQWIRSGGVLEFKLYDQLKQMFRARLLLASENDLITKMPEIIERLVMENTPPLTGNDYLLLYTSILV